MIALIAKRIAVPVGIVWMALAAMFGAWLGFREAFLYAPGLFFEGGYGEVYLIGAAFLPGFLLYRWGKG